MTTEDLQRRTVDEDDDFLDDAQRPGEDSGGFTDRLRGGGEARTPPPEAEPESRFPDRRNARTPVETFDREAVLADPLRQRTRPADPAVVQQREDAKPRVMAALAMHLGGHLQGMGPQFEQAVEPLAERFLDIAQNEPRLIRRLEEDVDALWALSDEAVASKIANGEELTSFDPIMDSLAEVYWSVGADQLHVRRVQESADAARSTYEGVTFGGIQELRERIPDGMQGGFLNALTSRPGAWSADGQSLALTVQGPDGDSTYTTQLAPGQKIRTDLDAIQAVVEAEHANRLRQVSGPGATVPGFGETVVGPAANAVLSGANELGKFVDGVPGAGQILDNLWKAAEMGFDPGNAAARIMVHDGKGPIELAGDELEAASDEPEVIAEKQAAILPFPEELIIGQVASKIVAEGGLASEDALDLASEMVDEDRDALESEFRRLTTEELVEAAEAAGEDKSRLGEAVDTAAGRALEQMEAWDAFTQRLGVNTIDFVWDAGRGVWETVAGDVEEGRRLFNEASEAPMEANVAEYWGLEGAGADLALLGTGILFDPTTWMFGGSRFASKLFSQAMTNPRFAPVAMRLGPMRSITRNIADETGSKATRTVLSMSGLSDRGYLELMDLAADPNATRQAVEGALMRELPSTDGVGFFLAEGPRRAWRRSTAQGIAGNLERIGVLDAERQTELFRSLTRLSRSRSMNLGESSFLDDFFDTLITVRPDDADFLEQWAIDAIDAVRVSRGQTTARQGVLAARKQRSRDLLNNMSGARANIVDDPVGIRGNMSQLRRALDTEGLDDATRAQLNDMHSEMSRRLGTAEQRHGSLTDRSRELNRELTATTRLEAELSTPETRQALADVVYRFYDDAAERINQAAGRDIVPIRQGAENRLAPGVPLRDWSAVTGGKKGVGTAGDDITLAMGLADDDVELAADLGAVGVFNRSTQVPLPASPYELVVAEKLANKPRLFAKWAETMRKEKVRQVVHGVKSVFIANLLLNPITAGKVHLDETLRFLADTGDVAGFLKSSSFVAPGTGRFINNPWAAQYGRRLTGFRPEELQPYQWVTRPKVGRDGFRRQAERWINGTLLNDDVFRQYARAVQRGTVRFVDDATFPGGKRPLVPDEFRAWWDEGSGTGRPGRANARDSYLTRDGQRVELDAEEAFAVIHRGWETWVGKNVDDSAQKVVRDHLLRAAVGERLPLHPTNDARILNAIKQIPGKGNNANIMDGAFDMFFGGPAQRRGGVFFEHYFDEAMDMYTRAYASKGRLLTRDTLVERAGVSAEEADWMIRQGSDNAFVRWLMDGAGAVTPRTLEAQAARYAARRSDDLLYRFSASTIAGNVAESGLAFPFARASLDFIGWWGNHLTRPMQFRLGPRAREAIASHPALKMLLEAPESVPLNLRALAKFAHLETMVNNDYESIFDQAIKDLTFLPTRWSREMLLSLTPNFGPAPSWMVDMGAAFDWLPDEAVAELEGLMPALAFTDETEGMVDRIIPSTGRTLRNTTIGALRGVASLIGDEEAANQVAGIADWVAGGQQPGYTPRFQAAVYADWLAENAFDFSPGSAEWRNEATRAAIDGMMQANKRDWDDRIRRYFNAGRQDPEYGYLGAYAGMLDDDTFDVLVEVGAFDQNDLLEDPETGEPRVKAVFARIASGDATAEEKEWAAETLRTTYLTKLGGEVLPGASLRDWLNVNHPEMTVNLVSKYQSVETPPRTEEHREFFDNYVDPDTFRLNLPPGPEGSELFMEARRKGWIANRPADGPEGWMRDAHDAALRSADKVLRGVWRQVAGQTSGGNWRSVGGNIPKSMEDVRFTLAEGSARALQATGLNLEAGDQMTLTEFQNILLDHRRRFRTDPPNIGNALRDNPLVADLSRHEDPYGRGLVDAVEEVFDRLDEQGLRLEDLSDEVPQAIRDRVKTAVDLGYTTPADYTAHWQRLFGPLDYEPPEPPAVPDLDFGIQVTREDIETGGIEVVDGDTVSVAAEDGPMRVRLVGINAPEVSQDGYDQAVTNLQQVIDSADEVVLGMFDTGLYGTTQISGPDEKRILAWLYVKPQGSDSYVPLFDPSVFSADNPRGAGTGGNVVDLPAILEAGP